MIALDTNVLVRLVTNDDANQARLAVKLIDSNQPFFVPLTVCLELEWVLRGAYGLSRESISECLEALLAIRNLSFESEPVVVEALAHYTIGFDFADSLHLASSSRCTELLTFDKSFTTKSKRRNTSPSVKRLGAEVVPRI